jgi:hypothetical protein
VNYVFHKLSNGTKYIKFGHSMSPWCILFEMGFFVFFKEPMQPGCLKCPSIGVHGAKKGVCFAHRILDFYIFSLLFFAHGFT